MNLFFIAQMNFLKGNMKLIYEKTDKFLRDYKKLKKRFLSLDQDFEVLKKNAIEIFHINNIDNRSIFEIKNIQSKKEIKFYKVKKFSCKSLKGRGSRTGIRIIYAFFAGRIFFLELYFKADQENENRQRIIDFIKKN